ncbi:unnamed protein product [Caenorhabditis angaria]|uniref:Cadherin domain-containing protein n=1 Tax=Caenorhabditis angaria TaxID=860376 RepID=A0A9P1I9L0_9PELO|nr:unnamed protein product [Caenorhabditis angaria]
MLLKLLIITTLCILKCQSRTLSKIGENSPEGSLVADLRFQKLISDLEQVEMQNSLFSEFFEVEDGTRIILAHGKSLKNLRGELIELFLRAKNDDLNRIVSLNLYIEPENSKSFLTFSEDIYSTLVYSTSPVGSRLLFSTLIFVKNLGSVQNLRIKSISYMENVPIMVLDSGKGSVELLIASPLDHLPTQNFTIYLAAIDLLTDEIQAQTKIQIQFKNLNSSRPTKLVLSIFGPLEENQEIFQVPSSNSNSSNQFKLDRESRFFEIERFTGKVRARKTIGPGIYTIFVIIRNKSETSVARLEIEVVSKPIPKANSKKPRLRRHLSDLVFDIPENELENLPTMKIELFPGENIGEVNARKDLLKIDENGVINLEKPLNFEKTSSIIATVAINGLVNSRAQTIRINVLDVDEPPAFVNSPLPMLAVVPLTPTIGRIVYQFVARDEAGDGNSDVIYKTIDVVPSGSFLVDTKSGVVRTAWSKYERGETYRVTVQAIDITPKDNSTSQVSEVAILEILAEDRPPQFAKQSYDVEISEDNQIDYSVVDMKAQSFRSIEDGRSKGEISYSFVDADDSKWFRIDPVSGIVHLTKNLDYDDPVLPKSHHLEVEALEDSKKSRVDLNIRIVDVNDNPPTFTRPLYTAQVREDIQINETILKVTAIDKDSGMNSEIVYSLDNKNFSINENGEISARVRLDADQFNERHFVYRFNVTAKDRGDPVLSSSAMVHIRTENTNDESAVFLPTSQYTAFVAEDAQGGTPVIQIQARDADRDEVTYSFLDRNGRGPTQTMNLFTIDQHTGLVKLRHGVTPVDLAEAQNPINLTVMAQDDGSCCVHPSETHISYATLLIGIEDVNNNKPEFPECAKYSEMAKIQEGTYKTGTPPTIIQVKAIDDDSSANGDIVYSLYYTQSESRKAFVIDRHTGILTPSPHVVFDRETRPREDVTVKATDRGDRPLIGFCQFSVEVIDVNDNAPQFERPSYETSISRFESIGTSVLTVFAYDNDASHNAEISYSLEIDHLAGEEYMNDIEFFDLVNRRSGEITLTRQIPIDKSKFVFNVVANDNGIPESQTSTAQVVLNVLDKQHKAPKWQSSPDCKSVIEVAENEGMNKVILKCRAIPGDGSKKANFYYTLKASGGPGSNAESKFRMFNRYEDGNEWVEVAIMETLDYETTKNYTLTLTATDVSSQVASRKTFVVEVQDVNDVVPQFTIDHFNGNIDEELTPNEFIEAKKGEPIVTINATDNDSAGPQSELHFRIVDSDTSKLFRIEELTGKIWPNEKFDRESQDMYVLTVEVRDNSQSALPGTKGPNKDNVKVQIIINDVNDNAPYFEESKYVGRVKESEGEGHDVITIKAHDLDKHSNLRYHLVGSKGGRIPFGVRTDSGTIFVNEPLDYEAVKQYHLILIASDGRHNASTNVYIHIDDVNDNAPIFEQAKYATTVIEEDLASIPKILFNVKAFDADKDEKSKKIVYKLEGQGADEVFRIGKYTGVIELIKALDRDPPTGIPSWNFVVQAIDDDGNGLVGYADVQVNVRDINDNSPVFPEKLYGFIEENREPIHSDGVYFMDVQAKDFDDPTTENANIEYAIVRNKLIHNEPVFRIDKATGKIFAMRSLDREMASEREFVIEVRANDRGVPSREGFANVTIKVMDKNDNAPFFEKTKYEGIVDETAPIGAAVMSFSAFDADVEAKDNVFTYQLAEESDYFYVSTDKDSTQSTVGVLRVKQALDYENPAQRDGFSLKVRVNDGRHDATAAVHVKLVDRNDHAPKITGPQQLRIEESKEVGEIIGKYTTSDADENDTAR